MRRTFSVSIYVRTSNPSGTDQVLLIEHKRHSLWLPLGGECTTSELPIDAARRKLKEEAEWEDGPDLTIYFPLLPGALVGSPPGLLGYEEHESGSRGLHMNFVFVAELITSNAVPKSDGSWTNFMWANQATVPNTHVPPNVRDVLHRLFNDKRR